MIRKGQGAAALSISTRRGDQGETDLLYGGRVPKYHLQTETYGALHEANAALGLARALLPPGPLKEDTLRIQKELIIVGAELACAPGQLNRLKERIDAAHVQKLDQTLAGAEAKSPVTDWVIPGESPPSAAFHLASTIVRRTERWAVRLRDEGLLKNHHLLAYLNRLADLLFMYGKLSEDV